jgi:tripartite-type tricarboxylate transporter receptor subunit TctC
VNKLNAEIVKALNTPELKKKLETQFGMQVVGSTPAELAAITQKDVTQLGELVRKVGATAE